MGKFKPDKQEYDPVTGNAWDKIPEYIDNTDRVIQTLRTIRDQCRHVFGEDYVKVTSDSTQILISLIVGEGVSALGAMKNILKVMCAANGDDPKFNGPKYVLIAAAIDLAEGGL